jgi:hypothetical protein
MSVRNVLNGDLNTWHGLPATETIASLTDELQPAARVLGPEERRRGDQRFVCTVFERPIAPTRVEAWVVVGEANVALLECDDPPATALDDTLRQYGPPDIVLSDRRFVPDAMVRELVYARRGVTFSVAEPFENASAPARRLVHLQLFSATTLEHYLTDIGASGDARPKTHPPSGPPDPGV